MFCLGGFCPRGFWQGGFLSGGLCPGGPGGFCPRTVLSSYIGGASLEELPLHHDLWLGYRKISTQIYFVADIKLKLCE